MRLPLWIQLYKNLLEKRKYSKCELLLGQNVSKIKCYVHLRMNLHSKDFNLGKVPKTKRKVRVSSCLYFICTQCCTDSCL